MEMIAGLASCFISGIVARSFGFFRPHARGSPGKPRRQQAAGAFANNSAVNVVVRPSGHEVFSGGCLAISDAGWAV